MELELSPEEARLLRAHLTRHIDEVDGELIHTERRALRQALATEVERLREIAQRLASLVAAAAA